MERMRNKSLKCNMILNGIKSVMSILFPLITFPYVSNVLGVVNLGKYNFSNSLISYFILFAGLGINTYAIREGARVRDKEDESLRFANEIFTINIYSTIISCFLLGMLILFVPLLQNYTVILLVLSFQVLFKCIGVEWLYAIYEDYTYITIRTILFQIVSIILMFIFVRSKDDIVIYAIITVFSSVGSNLFGFFHAKKYCRIRMVTKVPWNRHLKPILVLFAMSVAVTIYVNSDITILGFLCGDRVVGLYSVSVKVYSVIKTVLSSILVVSIPRLSSLLGKKEFDGFNSMAGDIYKILITIMMPAIVGLIVLRNEIVFFLSNQDYCDATTSLSLLSVALLFCLGAWFWGQCILVPQKKENTVFLITIISALVNISLNFVLIPIWSENAAAITTIIAEGIAFVWCGICGRKITFITGIAETYIKVIIGCIPIIGVSKLCHSLFESEFICVITTVFLSCLVYLVTQILLKNAILCKYLLYGIAKIKGVLETLNGKD